MRKVRTAALQIPHGNHLITKFKLQQQLLSHNFPGASLCSHSTTSRTHADEYTFKKLKPSETKELRFKFEFKSNFKHMNFNLSHTEDHSEYDPIQWNSVIITLIHSEDCKDVDREQHEQPNF